MGAVLSLATTFFTAPIIITISFLLSEKPGLQSLKSLKVLIISLVLWLLLLVQAGGDETKSDSSSIAMIISYLSSVVFLISGTVIVKSKLK